MKTINDGGPAFPMALNETTSSCSPVGMSLRDWFAGMALQGIMANGDWSKSPNRETFEASYSKYAYDYADAMLAEREKQS